LKEKTTKEIAAYFTSITEKRKNTPYVTWKIAEMWYSKDESIEKISLEIVNDGRNFIKWHKIKNFVGNKKEILKKVEASYFAGREFFLELLNETFFNFFKIKNTKTSYFESQKNVRYITLWSFEPLGFFSSNFSLNVYVIAIY
jgi:UDP-2,3-diacylglucosamine pyrophosphatase LpxH